MILSQKSGTWPGVTRDYLPRAARIIEVSWDGEILWEWMPAEHFEEFGHGEAARDTIFRGCRNQHCVFLNTVSRLGPNRWYDAGDERFHPENLISDDRGTIVFIISKRTGKIVWKVGPEYTATPALRELGPIIGPHNAHMIPRGLPGEGNILVFDNGGAAGFGPPNPGAPTGEWNALRDHSRVLEFDPVTLEIVWQHTAEAMGYVPIMEDSQVLQPLRERGPASSQRKHAHRGDHLRTHHRGHARERDRLGVRKPLQHERESALGPHVSRVPGSLRVDSAASQARREGGHPPEELGFQSERQAVTEGCEGLPSASLRPSC